MNKISKVKMWNTRAAAALTCLCLLLSLAAPAGATVREDRVEAAIESTGEFLQIYITRPVQLGGNNGDWAIFGLARSGLTLEKGCLNNYYSQIENQVKQQNGILSDKKNTEYSRVIVALTAMGKDPQNVAGYSLLTPLGNYEETISQGVTGAIYALLALDCGGYEMPITASSGTQATRQLYIDFVLTYQGADGGFSFVQGGEGEADITAMAIQVLANYQSQAKVKTAIDKALVFLSETQGADGGYVSWGAANPESVAQVIVALCELGIDVDDPRFVKNGNTLLDALLMFQRPSGGFNHSLDPNEWESDITTEQAFYALVAIQRAQQGKTSLYDMSDVPQAPAAQKPLDGEGLAGKHPDVTAKPITETGKTFPDIQNHTNQKAIEALAQRGIIQGITTDIFAPDDTMTRAQYAAIVVRALGLIPRVNDQFTDVSAEQWYAPYIGTAYSYGIVNGVTETTFAPQGTITKQEAATMLARAAALCGMNTHLPNAEVDSILSPFDDGNQVDSWARQSMAFCLKNDILDDSTMDLQPKTAICRCDIAQGLYELLRKANLL